MFQRFIIQTFFLNLAALIHCFHSAENATTFCDAVKFGQHCCFYKISKFFNDKRSLNGIFIFAKPSSLFIMSWIAIARLTDSSVGVVIASSYAFVCSELQLS